MTISKEMERLKSKMEFHKRLINELDNLNFITKSNKFDKKIENRRIPRWIRRNI